MITIADYCTKAPTKINASNMYRNCSNANSGKKIPQDIKNDYDMNNFLKANLTPLHAGQFFTIILLSADSFFQN